ncbi:hypothetical protein [Pedosphaera parvula]|uniref:Uncharacterized protein n=1 Tax=Pedosphaera parvula (strain Ellin514) TaxID=320771 RepID=B9XT35_PEDPL|nr:hypothetical protein [Pedosphaera parvula]EEF56996.1 hypothetical protein Cflav_PD0031 [Pedosphaera parvula Ellin514]
METQAIENRTEKERTLIKILTLLLLCTLAPGCHSYTTIPAAHTILTETYESANYHQFRQAERSLPTDVWVTHPKIGRYNQSRSRREIKLADELLDTLRPKLKSMRASELLDSLEVSPPDSYDWIPESVAFYFFRDGNEMIIEELNRRPKSEFETLRSYTEDRRVVFTDPSGEYLTVGSVVHRLLGDISWSL